MSKVYYKKCDWCGKTMFRQNHKRHLATCKIKNEINLTKQQIEDLKSNNLNSNSQNQEEIKLLELKHTELLILMKELHCKIRPIFDKYTEDDHKFPEIKIREMLVSESTKKGYLVEWRLYNKWRLSNSKRISAESANQYISSLKKQSSSTQFKKRNILQNVMKVVVDPNIKLAPFRKRFSYTPKYSMSEDEIERYLDEQHSLNYEDYMIQLLMINFGLRISTIACLKFKDLDFYFDDSKSFLVLPDVKNKLNNKVEIFGDAEKEFRKFLDKIEQFEETDYVFYNKKLEGDVTKRAHNLCLLINQRIKESKIFKHRSQNFKYTSHMFRKAIPNLHYQTQMKKIKKETRTLLGHKKNTGSLEHYVD